MRFFVDDSLFPCQIHKHKELRYLAQFVKQEVLRHKLEFFMIILECKKECKLLS